MKRPDFTEEDERMIAHLLQCDGDSPAILSCYVPWVVIMTSSFVYGAFSDSLALMVVGFSLSLILCFRFIQFQLGTSGRIKDIIEKYEASYDTEPATPPPEPVDPPDPPPPPETPEERDRRLSAKAKELLVLELCHRELLKRIDNDQENASEWRLKDKIAVQMAAYLRGTLPEEYRNPVPLEPEDIKGVIASHPLLCLGQHDDSEPTLDPDHKKRIHDRLKSISGKRTEDRK